MESATDTTWLDLAWGFFTHILELFWFPTIQIWEMWQADPETRPKDFGSWVMGRVAWQIGYFVIGGGLLLRLGWAFVVWSFVFVTGAGIINWIVS